MRIKRIIDVSRKISKSTPVRPGENEIEIVRVCSIEWNDYCNVSYIKMGLHTGTHIDAPFHFIRNGADIDTLELDRFIGVVRVIEVDSMIGCIGIEDIENRGISEGDAIFFKTSNSEKEKVQEFYKDYTYIGEAAADYLVEKKVRTVGIDFLSIDNFDDRSFPAHRIFLSAGVGIIEGLNLHGVEPGEYFFSALPLDIDGADASPVRAVLLEFE